jgi:hypothetical protein
MFFEIFTPEQRLDGPQSGKPFPALLVIGMQGPTRFYVTGGCAIQATCHAFTGRQRFLSGLPPGFTGIREPSNRTARAGTSSALSRISAIQGASILSVQFVKGNPCPAV